MKKIKLTKGKYTIVDDDMFEYLNQWKWYLEKNGYAVRKPNIKIYMHRLINKTPDGFKTDHINRCRLDNRKNNLRSVTDSVSAINTSLYKNNITGYKGVHFDKSRGNWMVYINKLKKRYYLGRYLNFNEALSVRKTAEVKYHTI